MPTPKITADEFFTVFLHEWGQLTKEEVISGATPWDGRAAWTERMLGHTGFFNRVMNGLNREGRNLEYHTEWYSIDALYVGGKGLYGKGLSYPSEIHVLIEHEFDEDVETELWKLAHWRSPLKVIVIYDWADSEKTTEKRKKFLDNKVAKLREMRGEIDAFHQDSADSEYILIVAHRVQADSDITWQQIKL